MSEPAGHNKRVVSLLVQAIGWGDLGAFDELCTARAASRAREWVGPFLESFPDVTINIVRTISEGDTVVARLRCSGTHLGVWRGHAPYREAVRAGG